MTLWLDIPFLLLLVVLAIMTLRVRRLFSAVATFGAYGFVIALEWALLGAVDVAFTEMVIGAAAWTVFMLATLRRIGEHEDVTDRTRRRRGALVALGALAVALVWATSHMPTWGDPAAPAATHVSPRYVEQAAVETGTPNMVTAVLGDYRSLDTLFELAVMFAAGMATILVLGLRRPERRRA